MSILLATILTVTCIMWEDATGYEGGWITEEEITEPAIVYSCGILLKEQGGQLYMIADRSPMEGEETLINGVSSVPLVNILHRVDFEVELIKP